MTTSETCPCCQVNIGEVDTVQDEKLCRECFEQMIAEAYDRAKDTGNRK